MSETAIEQEIKEKGLTAPRITPTDIDNVIVHAQYHVFPGTTTTVCRLTLRNGFGVIGESACASIENFDEELGRKIAYGNARDKVWQLEGYLLREKLSTGMTQAPIKRGLQEACHGAASRSGWWKDNQGIDIRENPLTFSNKLCLIHSEISEAMEGDRKGKMDDHLPHRQMREVELADAVIRIFDLAGGFGMDLGGAIAEKVAYNAQRADHKPENRKAEGGKAY